MVLNNAPQMYTIYFPSDFFYESVCQKWGPMIERMRLPYQDVTDFMNAQIQSIIFPSISLETAQQQREQYPIAYSGGKELEALFNRDFTITFKLTESYISYWIIWDQILQYLHYGENNNGNTERIWMSSFHLGFLNDAGYQLMDFTFKELVPTSLSELNLSYAATIASYNTFSFGLKYNYFDVNV